MGFLDQFSKEGREAAKSRREYDQCYKARREKLLSFRKNAVQEIMFTYPDARLLLNRLDRRFMVLLKSTGELLIGIFADDYYPRLDYVRDAASTSERLKAVARFLNEISGCTGSISKENMHRFKNGRKWLVETESTKCFQSKGYALTGSTKLEYLQGGALFLNKRMIAKASVWDPKPKGYFSTKILERVLQDVDNLAGTQDLIFVTMDENYGGEGQKMSYEILFDRSLQYFDENNRKEFAAAVLNLRDFMYDIEDYFKPECPMGEITAKDRAEWIEWTRRSAGCLESADRDEDRSMASRYLL